MTEEAIRILHAFRDRGLHSGGSIRFSDFGDAIQWEAGFVAKDATREALSFLKEGEYVSEHLDGLTLTEHGDDYLYTRSNPKFGARVYSLDGVLLIKQTVLRGIPPEYVINEQRERHVKESDNDAIAEAVRASVHGKL